MLFSIRSAIVLTTVGSVLLAGSPAHANIGLPMLFAVWPNMWLLLIPIILIEAAVGTRILHLNFLAAAQVAGIANLVSTLLGLPLTWGILVTIQMSVPKGGQAHGIDTWRGKLLAVTLQSPWLIPYERDGWIIPAAELFLCLPFFLMSVGTEFLSASLFTQGKILTKDVLAWACLANALSYALIALILIGMLSRAILKKLSMTQTAEMQSKWLKSEKVQAFFMEATSFVMRYFPLHVGKAPPKE